MVNWSTYLSLNSARNQVSSHNGDEQPNNMAEMIELENFESQ